MKTVISALLVLGFMMGIMSCSSNTNSITPSSATYYASVNSLGEEITTEQDTLQISTVRIVLEDLRLGYDGPPQIIMPGEAAIYFTQTNSGQRRQIASRQIAAQTYYSSEFSVSLPDQISVEHSQYSIYMTGMYNGEQFEFGTDTTFSRGLNFTGGLNVPAQDALIELTVVADLEDWFRGDGGVLLNPQTSDGRSEIEKNIKPSFDVDVESNIQ